MSKQTDDRPSWLERFPALQAIDDPVGRHVLETAQVLNMPAGIKVFHVGDPCRSYMLVLAGTVRVQMVSETGREIILYRVEPGEGCVLTTSCLLAAGQHYPAEGVTETPVRAVTIPLARFEEGLAGSAGFRHFVFATYGRRLADLIMLVEEVAFRRVDVRLAQSLLRRAGSGGHLSATHQDLALELGTAREVVSRQLKEFERHGWVGLHRGRIDVVDPAALRGLTGEPGGG